MWHPRFYPNEPPYLGWAALQLVFADGISEAWLNGKALALERSDEGSVARLGATEITNPCTIRFQPAKRIERLFVWLKGFFRVASASPFVSGPNNTIKTEGPFTVHPVRHTIQPDLFADGFPFLQTPLLASATIELPAEISSLRFEGVDADAVRLFVDGDDCGWTCPAMPRLTGAPKRLVPLDDRSGVGFRQGRFVHRPSCLGKRFQERPICFKTEPSRETISTTIGICPTACVEQLRHGS